MTTLNTTSVNEQSSFTATILKRARNAYQKFCDQNPHIIMGKADIRPVLDAERFLMKQSIIVRDRMVEEGLAVKSDSRYYIYLG